VSRSCWWDGGSTAFLIPLVAAFPTRFDADPDKPAGLYTALDVDHPETGIGLAVFGFATVAQLQRLMKAGLQGLAAREPLLDDPVVHGPDPSPPWCELGLLVDFAPLGGARAAFCSGHTMRTTR